MVETCALVLMRAVTKMLPTKISACIDPPNQFYCSIWVMILGTGNDFYWLGVDICHWLQVLHSVQVWGEVLPCIPSWMFKGLDVPGAGALMSCAPSPGSYSIGFGFNQSPLAWFWLLLAALLFWLPLCLWGLWPLLLGLWMLFLWPWLDPCHGGFCSAFWAPLTAAIKESNCCCISNHLAQGSRVGASRVKIGISFITSQAITNYARLRSIGVIMLFLLMCSPSAFLAAHIKTM